MLTLDQAVALYASGGYSLRQAARAAGVHAETLRKAVKKEKLK